MDYVSPLIKQLPGLAPHYTQHPMFGDMFTDIEKMNKIMKETNEWRKEYTNAIKKHDKARIEELKKKQAYVNKMTMEMQQQQMRPMLIYMMPSFMLWIFVFPSVFGATTAISPIQIPWLMCSDDNVKLDTQVDESGQPRGACNVPGEVFLWGWFLITSFAFSGIISKITGTAMPGIT